MKLYMRKALDAARLEARHGKLMPHEFEVAMCRVGLLHMTGA